MPCYWSLHRGSRFQTRLSHRFEYMLFVCVGNTLPIRSNIQCVVGLQVVLILLNFCVPSVVYSNSYPSSLCFCHRLMRVTLTTELGDSVDKTQRMLDRKNYK